MARRPVCTDASSEIKSLRAGFRVPLSFRPPLFGTLPQSVVTENRFSGSQVLGTGDMRPLWDSIHIRYWDPLSGRHTRRRGTHDMRHWLSSPRVACTGSSRDQVTRFSWISRRRSSTPWTKCSVSFRRPPGDENGASGKRPVANGASGSNAPFRKLRLLAPAGQERSLGAAEWLFHRPRR